MTRFNIGDSFETTVVAVTDTTVFVDLSAKSEGVVDVAADGGAQDGRGGRQVVVDGRQTKACLHTIAAELCLAN